MAQALIFSLEEFSVFDGPGVRTSVFLKGCPLRCSWCHNPEGQQFEAQMIKQQTGCTGCGACKKVTGQARILACPNRLFRLCGEAYTPERLVKRLEGNFEILRFSGGGITFSGGEPLAHAIVLEQCLGLLRGQIHTAIQTSGYAPASVFERILPNTDYILFDLKLADDRLHRRYTEVGNKEILQNFSVLCKSGKPFTVRTPLIPGVTDTEENLTGIAEILRKNGVDRIELLPYNRAAGGKYAAIGKSFTPDYDETRPVTPRFALFASYGIHAVTL